MCFRQYVVVLITTIGVLSTVAELDANSRRTESAGESPTVLLSDDVILKRLRAIEPLPMKTHGSRHLSIKSQVFCYCLHKGPKLAQHLRHQATTQFQKGLTAFKANEKSKAIEAFTRAAQLNPRDPLAYINRGLSYSYRGSFQLAEADFSRALKVDAQHGLAYYARGLVTVLLGNSKEAQRDFHRATEFGDTRASELLNMITLPQPLRQ